MVEGGTTTETHYHVDRERPYSEIVTERTRINTGSWQERTYLHTPDGVGELISEVQGDTVIYHYPDGHGSTRLTADANEAVLGTLHYDAFGNRTGGNIGVSHQYTGEYFDEYTGFYHLRARDYDPRVGRFISMDAFEGVLQDPLTRNKYLYAHGDPVNNRDPSGYMTMVSVGQIGMVALAVAGYQVGQSFAKGGFDTGVSNRDAGLVIIMTMMGHQGITLFNMMAGSDVSELERQSATTAGEVQALSQSRRASGRRAVIGENQRGRVIPAALYLRAITIQFTPQYTFSGNLSAKEKALSLAFNYGWIKVLMAENFEIYDIGRDPARVATGEGISPWYLVEANAVRGYDKHFRIKWPMD